MSSSGARKKRHYVELVDETPESKVYVTKRVYGRDVIKKHYFVLKREPQFTVETKSDGDFEFIRLTRTNQLVGRLKDGLVERRKDVDKLFYLSKLDLTPKPTINDDSTKTNGLPNGTSCPDDEQYQSSTSQSSPMSGE